MSDSYVVRIIKTELKYFKNIPFLNSIQNLAVYCAQKNVSVFLTMLLSKI